MISKEKGRGIAGQKLINKFGKEYLIANKEKLSFIENVEKNILTVTFTLHRHLDEVSVEKKAEFMLKKSIFQMNCLLSLLT